ncbi:hypothetical protein IWQ62_002860 [Dispira parvispora]|uniref:Uncharacterized protein n=1 Tax=Dispira parvispora TaxID=1520584 RepID=A0A9W8AV88_9FUNG|nr:hypothetical protein IWQ62_002860 [Dispira parvispora]
MAIVASQPVLGSLLQAYLHSLDRHPLVTKALTSGILQGLQEQLALVLSGTSRSLSSKKKTWALLNPKVVQMTLYGLLISGPMGHFLYAWLSRWLAKRSGPMVPVLMLLVSNLVISPIQNAVYVLAMAYIAGQRSPKQLLTTLHQQWPGLQKVSCVLFPVVQLVASKLLHPNHWVPFFNLMGFVFGLYFNTLLKRQRRKTLTEKKD